MTIDAYVRQFVSRQLGLDASEIASFRFHASEGYSYSEYTYEDFSAHIWVTLRDGAERAAYLAQSEVVDFLNGFSEAQA